jgi:uncharacterized protein
MDFIRGIAVLGLVFMNIYAFGIFELGYVPLTSPPLSDSVINTISIVFVDGRFRTLFSLLFGAGLFIQWQRYNSTLQLKRRLYWLMIFGFAHGFILWAGDILLTYALAGWFALRYLESDNKTLLTRSLTLNLICFAVTALVMFTAPNDGLTRSSEEFISMYNRDFSSYSAYFFSNIAMNMLMVFMVPLMTLWMSAGVMLMGVYLYKQGVFTQGLNNKHLQIALLGSGVFSVLRLYFDKFDSGLFYALKEPINIFAALSIASLYIHLSVKLCNNRESIGRVIQQAGRIAFTLYISQTLMQLLLFKVFFTQWVLSFNRIDYWLVATALVVIQLVFTVVYGRYFNQGPIELFWRKLSKVKRAA